MTQAAARPLVDLDSRSASAARGERGPWRTRRRRRRVPYLALGGLLVVVCVLGFAAAAMSAGGQTSTGAGTTTRLSAVVLGVDPRGDGQGSTVVTLLLDASDAGRLAGAGGVMLMQTAPGGD